MKAYRNNGASHFTKDGVEVPRGGIIKTSEDLVKAFPNKFEEVSDNQKLRTQATKKTGPVEKKQMPRKNEEPGGKKNSDEKIDVTEKFTIPGGYTVKRDRRGCWVFDGDEEPANEKPLKREEVEPFIKECAE